MLVKHGQRILSEAAELLIEERRIVGKAMLERSKHYLQIVKCNKNCCQRIWNVYFDVLSEDFFQH